VQDVFASKDQWLKTLLERSAARINCTKNYFGMFMYFAIADACSRALSHEQQRMQLARTEIPVVRYLEKRAFGWHAIHIHCS
jgi:hypothetical protein